MTMIDQVQNDIQQPNQPQHINVSSNERTVSVAAGAILTLYALSRFGLRGLLAAGLGAGLVYRGMTGHCAAYEKLDIDTTQNS